MFYKFKMFLENYEQESNYSLRFSPVSFNDFLSKTDTEVQLLNLPSDDISAENESEPGDEWDYPWNPVSWRWT